MAVNYYVSATGTVHLLDDSGDDGDPGRVILCTNKTRHVRGQSNMRWGGYPSLEDLVTQATVESLEGNKNKKLIKRLTEPPKLVCLGCFPMDPLAAGVL